MKINDELNTICKDYDLTDYDLEMFKEFIKNGFSVAALMAGLACGYELKHVKQFYLGKVHDCDGQYLEVLGSEIRVKDGYAFRINEI